MSGQKTIDQKTMLTDSVPEGRDHRELRPNGQQLAYVVLTPEERAKGFVRPVRESYRHVGTRPKHPTRELTADEHEQYDRFGYVAYEGYPDDGSGADRGPFTSAVGRYWTRADLESGCGTVTNMARALAETYARDPRFYCGTFCAGCGKHLPLEQFVWEGTDERVGS